MWGWGKQPAARSQPSPSGPAEEAVLVWCGKEDGGEAASRGRPEAGYMLPDPRDLYMHSWGKFRFRRKDLRRVRQVALLGSCCCTWQPQGGPFLPRTHPTPSPSPRGELLPRLLCAQDPGAFCTAPTVSVEGAHLPTLLLQPTWPGVASLLQMWGGVPGRGSLPPCDGKVSAEFGKCFWEFQAAKARSDCKMSAVSTHSL